MDIGYLLKVLWRKKWWILSLSVISCVVAFLLTLSMPDKYRALSRISTGFTADNGINVTDERFNVRDADVKFSNLLSIMNSSLLFNFMSYELTLHDLDPLNIPFHQISEESDFYFTPAQLDTVRSLFKQKLNNLEPIVVNEEHSQLMIDVLQAYNYTYGFMRNNTEINRVQNTDYIEVSFISNNASLSSYATNAYCSQFLKYYSMMKAETSSESVEFFKNLVEQKQKELSAKSDSVKSFKGNHNFMNIEREGDSRFSQIGSLEVQRDEVNSNLFGLRLRRSDLRESLSELNGQNSGNNANVNQRVISIRKKIDDLNERYVTSGSTNTQLLDSLTLLHQQYRFELTLSENRQSLENKQVLSKPEILDALKQTEIEIRVAELKLAKINGNINSIRGNLSGFASSEAKLNALDRELNVASNEYLDAVAKYNEAKNRLMATANSLKQTMKASPPASPESSQQIMLIIFAGVTTFGLCVLVIVVIELLDSSIKTPHQFQNVVDIPLAGSLIKIDVKKLNFNTLFSEQHNDEELELFKHFLRKIRYEIEKTGAKSFMITSPKVGEGKTFILFALAYVLSLINRRILIIDTNFKNNTLTRWLSESRKNVKLLERKKDAVVKMYVPDNEKDNEPSINLVSPTKYNNIFFIGNAGGYDSPEEIFHDKDFKNLIKALRNDFDYILIEGAALNDYSDSKELMKYVEKIIPVFSADSTIKQLDKESIDYLLTMENRLTGAILNQVDLENINT